MAHRPDLVLRNGTVIDGSGGEPFRADVAASGGVITEVGAVGAAGREEIDAAGCLVTPGFVDIHTHYDGQVTWDSRLAPSSLHGVTTAVLGNCGVGFAPVQPAHHEMLIELMEGVEDIPGAALHEGLPWTWSSFPEYLDADGPGSTAHRRGSASRHSPATGSTTSSASSCRCRPARRPWRTP